MFVVTRSAIEAPLDWNCLRFGCYYVYSHPDLGINLVENAESSILLIGDIYDHREPQRANVDILHDIMEKTHSINECIAQTENYAGCFALLCSCRDESIVLHDARGLREVYYCTSVNRVVCASQPNLIAKYAEPELQATSDRELLTFYRKELWDSRWVGDETIVEGIKHLIPNHLLDIDSRKVRRYWPNKTIKKVDLEEGVLRVSTFLRGTMKAIVSRKPAMMAVTAGEDSRVLLAASKGMQTHLYYFVNDYKLGSGHPDIAVPVALFETLGIPFHVHSVSQTVDDKFRIAFHTNTLLANERLLPSLYDMYVRKPVSDILILGVSEIGRTFYGEARKPLTGYQLAYKIGYPHCVYVNQQCDKLAKEIESVSDNYGVSAMALFYWEQRLGNWGATRNSESLIAVSKIDPFNSHCVYETYLGISEEFRNYRHSPCVFSGKLVEAMWPELLEVPVNPAYGLRDRTKAMLSTMRLLDVLRETKYFASRTMSKITKAVKALQVSE